MLDNRKYLPSLTGLRFLASFLVLFAHSLDSSIQFDKYQNVYTNISSNLAYLGISLFFILSGFVIHYNYGFFFAKSGIKKSIWKFLIARFSRIYPLFFFFFLVSLATIPWAAYQGKSSLFIYFLTMTQSWFFTRIDQSLIIQLFYPHSWSISTEFFFYLFYPLIFLLILQLKSKKKIILAIIFSVIVTYGILLGLYYQSRLLLDYISPTLISPALNEDTNIFYAGFVGWLSYFCPYVRIFEFILGCLIAHLFMHIDQAPPSQQEKRRGTLLLYASVSLLIAMLIYSVVKVPFDVVHNLLDFLRRNYLFTPLLGIILFCTARYQTFLSQFLTHPTIVELGEVSYSTYLLHLWIIGLFRYAGNPPFSYSFIPEWLLRMGTMLSLSIIFAFSTYRIIEIPARLWLRNRFNPKPANL